MMPVISFWSKGQAPVDLNFYLPGSPQLHIYSLTKPVCEKCLVSNTRLAINSDK